KILEKLKLKKKDEPAPAPAKIVASERPASALAAGQAARAAKEAQKAKDDVAHPAGTTAAGAPAAISVVDVVKHLEELSAGKDLNWKVSIVDLLKVLGIDSSREARNELATELGCPADLMKDSAKMNVWLHKEVLKKIAENGGNIPASLLD
ncbi:MAG: DUF3597 domain-containing protein, partial [Anaerolineales bacterium]|nr:DUF3597 domain-containing protein [Anaerolineales bacterium]